LRTKKFALRILKLFQALPRNEESRTLGRQLLRPGTSVAANYRAVCRVLAGILMEGGMVPQARLNDLHPEAKELLAIFITSQMTAKGLRRPNSSLRQSDNPTI
jgi:hypothetical protein